MANEQRRRFNFTTTTAATSSPAASTTVTCFRSQSAPPRKKWYRRGASLLTRQRSTRQQAADGTPACSMLYDQVVSRRLVGAIAAWHDLHASLLQLSLNQHAEQGADGAQTRGDQNTGSSSSSSVSPNGKQRKERLSSKAARSDRKKGGSSGACAGSSADGCRVHGARRAREGADAPPSPSRDSPISSAGAKMTPSGLIHTPSRSSSLASGGSSSANERHRRRHRQMVDRPDIDDEASSSHCTNLDILQGPPSSSEGRRRQQSPGGGGDISPNDNNNWTTRSAADFRRHPKAAGRASAGVVGEKPAPATWSATFAQSLKIRSSTRRRARSPIPRARSPAPTRQIVIKHSVQLVQPNHQPMPPGEWFDQPMPPPGLLSLTRSSTTAKTGYRRRCFNVEKVPENEGGAEEKRRRLRQQCSCRDGQSEGEEEEDWASGSGEEDEEEESGASSGILSDAELDCLYEEERNRPKMSMSSPELTPDQLKQLFPELSDHWRKALAKSPVVKRAAAIQEQEHKRVPKHRTSRYWLDEQLTPSEHIWLPSSSTSSASSSAATVDTECYLGEKDCEKLGEKRRCAACHIVAHTACFPLLAKMNLSCKNTFRDCAATSSSNRRHPAKEANGDALLKHHWVHRWRLEGRCFHCGKSFQQKMFREKEVIAITCSWCKRSYHNKKSCFSLARFDDHCDRGLLRELILPPAWLLRLGNSARRHQRRLGGSFTCKDQPQQVLRKSKRKYRPFVIKQFDHQQQQPQSGTTADSCHHHQQQHQMNGGGGIPAGCPALAAVQPLLVFVNPKSGGNKGAKALNSLCWLLNPRQVFDINAMRGPKFGLEMFRKVAAQMRILVCGGDGTVGWVLSTLDQLNWSLYPPIALLPLGTGNDLSRTMGWGGTFSDEPLAEMLQAIQTETSVTHLDRWRLDVFPLPPTTMSNNNNEQQQQGAAAMSAGVLVSSTTNGGNGNNGDTQDESQQQPPTTPTAAGCGGADTTTSAPQTALPLSVMNNYFSIGADAHVALQFHHSRSANPQMLNSRLKNRIAYGGLGTIDLFKRTWKDLSEFIAVECDGVDITPKIRDFKFHCILFHNIGFYAGGTLPWGAGGDGVQESCGEVFSRPSSCDGKIEVLGFTTATLAALQMGGKGERIAQCSRVRIETSKPIPMQVDGEPCLLGPSLILLSFHNKVPMLRREKFARMSGSAPANNIVSMNANNRRKSSNNGGAGAGGGGSPSGTAPVPPAQHKCSRASLCADGIAVRPTASSPPNSVFMCVPIVVVGRHDYDTYRDSVDRLKDTGFELGTLNVEAEMELGQVRLMVQHMLVHHQMLPYEPGHDWRFLDYVSNSEEGAFRISDQQEQCRTVADVCSLDDGAGILILDDAFPSMTARSAAIGHELVFCPAGGKAITAAEQNLLMRRRISETLRIVLSSESQETHL